MLLKEYIITYFSSVTEPEGDGLTETIIDREITLENPTNNSSVFKLKRTLLSVNMFSNKATTIFISESHYKLKSNGEATSEMIYEVYKDSYELFEKELHKQQAAKQIPLTTEIHLELFDDVDVNAELTQIADVLNQRK